VTGRFSCACAASVTPRGQGGLTSAVWDRNPPFRTHGRRTLLPSARLACVSCLSCVRKYTHRQPAGQSAPGPARARRKCLTSARNLQAYASERGPNEQNRFKARQFKFSSLSVNAYFIVKSGNNKKEKGICTNLTRNTATPRKRDLWVQIVDLWISKMKNHSTQRKVLAPPPHSLADNPPTFHQLGHQRARRMGEFQGNCQARTSTA